MAKCEKRLEYVLTLTEREAWVLRSLLGFHVAGLSPTRNVTSAIWNALHLAGVPDSNDGACFTGTVDGKEFPEEAPDA